MCISETHTFSFNQSLAGLEELFKYGQTGETQFQLDCPFDNIKNGRCKLHSDISRQEKIEKIEKEISKDTSEPILFLNIQIPSTRLSDINRPVYFANCDLSYGFGFKGEIEYSVRISHSDDIYIDVNDVQFKEKFSIVRCEGVRLKIRNKNTEFSSLHIENCSIKETNWTFAKYGHIDFKNCIFKDYVLFSPNKIDTDFTHLPDLIVNCKFEDELDVSFNYPNCDFKMNETTFKDDVKIRWINNQNNNLYLNQTIFKGSTKIEDIHFDRANFKEAEFYGDLIIKNSSFIKSNFTRAKFNSSITFHNSDLSNSNLEYVSLKDADLRGTDLTKSNLYKCDLTGVNIDSKTSFLYESQIANEPPINEEFNNMWVAHEGNYLDKSYEEKLHIVKDLYADLERIGKENYVSDLSSTAFVNKKDMTREINDSYLLRFQRHLFLYGESPYRVGVWSIGIVFGFAIIYSYLSGSSISSVLRYSILTFIGIGGGDILELNSTISNWLVVSESILGVIFIALLIFTITRSVSR